jgi:thiol-disulfide isomerase/thioredoxin
MKHIILTTIMALLIILNFVQAQSYEDEAEKCTADFQRKLANKEADVFSTAGHCLVGLPFPYFNLTSIDGEQYKLSELKGKIIMLNFWFIDCSSCVDQIPLLNQLAEEYKEEDFLLLSFSTDDKEIISNVKKSHELKYVVFENSRDLIQETFHIPYGYPTNIFLDKEGKIIDLKLGGDPKKLKTTFKGIIDTGLMK